MAIQQRILKRMPDPVYRDGYPDLLFEGYRMRFGHVNAVFTNANMQSLAGVADPAINRMHCQGGSAIPPATIFFYYKEGLAKEIDRRKELNLKWDFLQEVLDGWPVGGIIPSVVRNRVGDE